MTLLTTKPIAGEPMRLAISGPPGEVILLTTASRAHVAPQTVDLGPAGTVEASVATERAWWPSVEIVASTRSLRGGKIEKRLQAALSRPDAPTIAIETDKADYLAGEGARVALRVTSKTPPSQTTVSLAVVDDRLLRFAGCGMPDPEAALRPRTAPLAVWATSSPAPFEAPAWYAGVLAREDRVPVMPMDGRISAAATGRSWPRGPLGSAAQDVGGWKLWASTAEFKADVSLDERGQAVVTIRIHSEGRWRIIAAAIDADGGSSTASVVIASRPDPNQAPVVNGMPELTDPRRASVTQLTTARAFLAESSRDPTTNLLRAKLRPDRLASAGAETTFVTCYPFPSRIADALGSHLDRTADSVDHVAARIIRDAARLPSTDPQILAALSSDLALLRELKTRDGYAWRRGEATDFEAAPLALHALSSAAEAGVDTAAIGASPDMRDGFLRVAPHALADAQGNPQAALEIEDLRNHEAFIKSVPPGRRALVLVDTVIGMLAVDPALPLPKTALASLVRQTQQLPGDVLARAGLALLRAGDRESANLVRMRLAATPESTADVARLALELRLARLLDAPKEEQTRLAEQIASRFTEVGWPSVFDTALAYSALRSHYGSDSPEKIRTIEHPTVSTEGDIEVESESPALCIAFRGSSFVNRLPPSALRAAKRRVFLDGAASPDGSISVPLGALLRFEITADAPAGSCAVVCPIPTGMRVLSAPRGTIEHTHLVDGWSRPAIVWLIRSPTDAPVRFEGWITIDQRVGSWDPCELISLDSLEILGWSASTKFDVTPPSAANRPGPSTATALDLAALAKAREEIVKEIQAAPDRDAGAKRIKELLELPDPGVPDALLAVLPTIAPLLDAPDVLVPVLVGLGERRSELWSMPSSARSRPAGGGLDLLPTWRTDIRRPGSSSHGGARLANRSPTGRAAWQR